MHRRLDPLPMTLRTLSDSEYDYLKESSELRSPDWRVRKGGSLLEGTRHINRHCPTCDGAGEFKFWNVDRTKVIDYICPCLDQWTLTRLLASAGLSRSYQELGWADLDHLGGIPFDSLEYVLDYRDNIRGAIKGGRGMILTGLSGSGKTMVASLLLKKALSHGYDGHFIGVLAFTEAYADGWGDKEKDRWFEQRVKGVDLLVIDDLGAMGETRLAERALHEVIRHRMSSLKPTILTSEHDLGKLKSLYDNIVKRADERSIHVASGQNWRQRAEERRNEEAKRGISRPAVLE